MGLKESIEEVLSEFRKSLRADGGDIELVDIEEGIVRVKITRTQVPVTFSTFLRKYKTREGISCGKCRIPTVAIVGALESALKEKIPGIIKVEVMK